MYVKKILCFTQKKRLKQLVVSQLEFYTLTTRSLARFLFLSLSYNYTRLKTKFQKKKKKLRASCNLRLCFFYIDRERVATFNNAKREERKREKEI